MFSVVLVITPIGTILILETPTKLFILRQIGFLLYSENFESRDSLEQQMSLFLKKITTKQTSKATDWTYMYHCITIFKMRIFLFILTFICFLLLIIHAFPLIYKSVCLIFH